MIAAYGLLHPGGGMGGSDISRPATLLIGPNGVVLWRNLTENWRVRVQPDAVLAAIEQLN